MHATSNVAVCRTASAGRCLFGLRSRFHFRFSHCYGGLDLAGREPPGRTECARHVGAQRVGHGDELPAQDLDVGLEQGREADGEVHVVDGVGAQHLVVEVEEFEAVV